MKVKKFFTNILSFITAATLLLGCGICFAPVGEDNAVEVQAVSADYYVRTRVNKSYLFGYNQNNNWVVSIRIPELLLTSTDAENVNKEIRNNFDELVNYCDNSSPTSPPDLFEIDYECFINGDILSLVINQDFMSNSFVQYYTYNFNVKTGKRVYNSYILNYLGVSPETARAEIINAVCTDDCYYFPDSNAFIRSQIEDSMQKSLTNTNLNRAVYFISGSGMLGAIYVVVPIAGPAQFFRYGVFDTDIKLTLDKTDMSIHKGNSSEISANVNNNALTWTTSNSSVATVSNGIVTAKGVGFATITAKNSRGNAACCSVTVKEPVITATGITLSQTSLTIEKGKSQAITAFVSPSNATNKTITWTTSDSSVAVVSADGKISARSVGTAIITAKTSNGKTASCNITVPVIDTTGITLNVTSLSINKDSTTTLSATVLPANATDKTVKWRTDKSYIASVDSSGKIHANSAGTATITAETNNGKTAACKVTVIDPTIKAASITLNISSLKLTPGESYTLLAHVLPEQSINKSVTWTTSNKAVASVSNGKVTAIALGTATITAETDNGIKANCTVKVNPDTHLKNTSLIDSDIVQVGDKVRISPFAKGGSGEYSSAVYYKRSTSPNWRILSGEFSNTFTSANTSSAFQPTSEGIFDIKVVIKDTNGTTSEKLFRVTAVNELKLTNVSVVSRESIKIGTAISMIGKAVGGKGSFTYAFYFKRTTNTNWKNIGDKFTTTASARFKPTATGTYDIRIDVKDKSGTVVKKFFTATVK